jgi:hypothetical protein
MSKAALSSMEWRSIRIPFARSATARRPKTPSRSWLREAARCYPFRVEAALAVGAALHETEPREVQAAATPTA